jgi:hypothetical protein
MEKTYRKHNLKQEWYCFEAERTVVVCNDERKMVAVFGYYVQTDIAKYSEPCEESEFTQQIESVLNLIRS